MQQTVWHYLASKGSSETLLLSQVQKFKKVGSNYPCCSFPPHSFPWNLDVQQKKKSNTGTWHTNGMSKPFVWLDQTAHPPSDRQAWDRARRAACACATSDTHFWADFSPCHPAKYRTRSSPLPYKDFSRAHETLGQEWRDKMSSSHSSMLMRSVQCFCFKRQL